MNGLDMFRWWALCYAHEKMPFKKEFKLPPLTELPDPSKNPYIPDDRSSYYILDVGRGICRDVVDSWLLTQSKERRGLITEIYRKYKGDPLWREYNEIANAAVYVNRKFRNFRGMQQLNEELAWKMFEDCQLSVKLYFLERENGKKR